MSVVKNWGAIWRIINQILVQIHAQGLISVARFAPMRGSASSMRKKAKARFPTRAAPCRKQNHVPRVRLDIAPEIIKDANEVAIKIGDDKLAQLPRFILGLGNDLRLRGLPLCEKFVPLRPKL